MELQELLPTIVGVLAGGLISALTSLWLFRTQWSKQRKQSRCDDISRRVAELHELAWTGQRHWGPQGESTPAERGMFYAEFRAKYRMLVAVARIEAPGLVAVLRLLEPRFQGEPHRHVRRLQSLRGWGHGRQYVEEVST